MRSIIPLSLVALFLLGAAGVLWPFRTHNVLVSPGLDKNRPAGQITSGFTVSETVPASFMGSDPVATADCIALRFATYMRRNEGTIQVSFGQEGLGHRWTLDTSRLDDNAYVNLCLERPIQPGKPFWIEVSGVEGTSGSAATVWLSAAPDRSVLVNGTPQPGWGLALRLTQAKDVSLAELVRLDHGAFIAGFIASLLIGFLILSHCLLRSSSPPRIANQR